MRRGGLTPLLAGAVLLVWFLANALSRGQGLYFFLTGLALLGLAVAAFRRGRRGVLYGLCYVLVLGSATALAVEIALRVRPGLLGGHVANVAYTAYHWQKGGMYRLDPHAGPVLFPSVRLRTYWAGRWWWHETNAQGFRGPALERADAVFLGDSMIYGHGLEAEQAVPARFAARTGLSAANLGQQGTGLIQSWQTLRRTGLALRPRWVFVCAHPTDIGEALRYYDPGELARFAAADGPDAPLPRVRDEYRPRPWWDPAELWSRHLALPMRSAGILGALARSRRDPNLRLPLGRDPFVPSTADRAAAPRALDAAAPPDERLPWLAERRAAARIKRDADAIGARVVFLDLGYPDGFSRAVEETARELGAAYSPAGRTVLARCLGGEVMYLPDDGHWSAAGADAVAAELAAGVGLGVAPARPAP
jgi:hypothetical protein